MTGPAPMDLSISVITSFIECKVNVFQLNYTGLHNLVGNNPKALSIDEIIRTLKTKLRSLKAHGLRSPSERKKLDT